MFGLKRRAPPPPTHEPIGLDTESVETDQQAELDERADAEADAEFAAIIDPPDIFHIEKDFTQGTFYVTMWSKQRFDDDGYVIRWSGYDRVSPDLPTHKAAEAWLRAYLDPSTNRTAYDAQGRRIETPAV